MLPAESIAVGTIGVMQNPNTWAIRAAVLVVLLSLVPVLIWVQANGDEIREGAEIEQVNEQILNPQKAWAREKLYYEGAEESRRPCPQCPFGVLLGDRTGLPVHQNPDRIRVLAVSDSYAVGAYLPDLDARWWVQLEDLLNKATAEGTFEVVGIGRSGASGFTYATWLENLAGGDGEWFANDAAGVTKKPFDLIVIGHVGNDSNPDPRDIIPIEPGSNEVNSTIPPVAGSKEVIAAYQLVPDRIAKASGGADLYMANLFKSDDDTRIRALYEKAGFASVDMAHTGELMREYSLRDLIVTPVDGHPNGAQYRANARDISEAILKDIDKDRLGRAMAGSAAPRRPFIGSYMPTNLEVTIEPDRKEATVSWAGENLKPECTYAGGGDDSRDTFLRCGEYTISGEKTPAQHTPCAALGRPYVQVMFERNFRGSLDLTLSDASGRGYIMHGYGYDREGFPKITPLGDLSVGQTLTIETGNTISGVLISAEGYETCAWEREQDGIIPAFALKVVARQ